MGSINLFGAFLGGMLAILSPCSVMLLPAFFAYAFPNTGRLVSRTGVFLAGLVVTLVPIGALAGTLGGWINLHRGSLLTWFAVIVIVFGVVMLFGIRVPGLTKTQGASSASTLSVFSLGAVYGLAGGCAGPIFGAILALSAFGGSALTGALTMFVYAVGMVVPMLLLALLWDRLPIIRRIVRPRELVIGKWRNSWTFIIGGLITIAVGILLIVTDGTEALSGVLGVDQQAVLENGALRAGAAVPDWVVLLVLVACALVIWWFARRARESRPESVASSEARE